jgi:hypothetical protein
MILIAPPQPGTQGTLEQSGALERTALFLNLASDSSTRRLLAGLPISELTRLSDRQIAAHLAARAGPGVAARPAAGA